MAIQLFFSNWPRPQNFWVKSQGQTFLECFHGQWTTSNEYPDPSVILDNGHLGSLNVSVQGWKIPRLINGLRFERRRTGRGERWRSDQSKVLKSLTREPFKIETFNLKFPLSNKPGIFWTKCRARNRSDEPFSYQMSPRYTNVLNNKQDRFQTLKFKASFKTFVCILKWLKSQLSIDFHVFDLRLFLDCRSDRVVCTKFSKD